MEPKITVVAKDGQANVKIGADIITLEDKSKSQFKTQVIDELVKYVGYRSPVSIFCNSTSILAYHSGMVSDNGAWGHDTIPVAVCTMEYHPKLVFLLKVVNGQPIFLKDMEYFLDLFKNDICVHGRDLRNRVKDFRVSTITEIVRQKDQKGNYHYQTKRTVRGKEEQADYEFPEVISLKIPLFKYDSHIVNIEIELRFDFKEGDNNVAVTFQLINLDINTMLDELAKEYITAKFSERPADGVYVFWGSLDMKQQTDSWKYKFNYVEDK